MLGKYHRIINVPIALISSLIVYKYLPNTSPLSIPIILGMSHLSCNAPDADLPIYATTPLRNVKGSPILKLFIIIFRVLRKLKLAGYVGRKHRSKALHGLDLWLLISIISCYLSYNNLNIYLFYVIYGFFVGYIGHLILDNFTTDRCPMVFLGRSDNKIYSMILTAGIWIFFIVLLYKMVIVDLFFK